MISRIAGINFTSEVTMTTVASGICTQPDLTESLVLETF